MYRSTAPCRRKVGSWVRVEFYFGHVFKHRDIWRGLRVENEFQDFPIRVSHGSGGLSATSNSFAIRWERGIRFYQWTNCFRRLLILPIVRGSVFRGSAIRRARVGPSCEGLHVRCIFWFLDCGGEWFTLGVQCIRRRGCSRMSAGRYA